MTELTYNLTSATSLAKIKNCCDNLYEEMRPSVDYLPERVHPLKKRKTRRRTGVRFPKMKGQAKIGNISCQRLANIF